MNNFSEKNQGQTQDFKIGGPEISKKKKFKYTFI